MLLIDRAVPAQFAQAFRSAGYEAHALREIFPDREQELTDVEWIKYAGQRGWIVLTMNPTMSRNTLELEAIRRYGTRVFSLGGAQDTIPVKGLVFGRWWLSILRRSERDGGCFWRLYFGSAPIKTIN